MQARFVISAGLPADDVRLLATGAEVRVSARFGLAIRASNIGEAIEREIVALLREWSLGPVAEALQALRGVGLVIAAGVAAEVGDVRRFGSPRQLIVVWAWCGDHSSGETRQLTGITKAGSIVARQILVEAAWAHRMLAKIDQAMHR